MKNDIEAALGRPAAGPPAHRRPERRLRALSGAARPDAGSAPGLTVILGPNGAGKTTLLKAIAGLIPRQGGRLTLDGEIAAGRQDQPTSCSAGLALVPEGRQLFPQMTVAENLELGGWLL